MEIKWVRFEAFKSLYDVSCNFEHLTVITGPNGAGKSNFVDGLNFLGEVYANGLENAVSRAGGFENIAHRRSRRVKKSISFSIEVSISDSDVSRASRIWGSHPPPDLAPSTQLTYRHSFSIRTSSQSLRANYRVEKDVIELIDERGKTLFRREREGEVSKIFVSQSKSPQAELVRQLIYPLNDKQFIKLFSSQALSETALISEQMKFGGLLTDIGRQLGGIRIFQLSPYQLRLPGVPTPNAFLERHGENLAGAADYLSRTDRQAWRDVQQAMRSILPNLIEVEVVYTEDRRLALRFKEENIGRPWSSGEVSDGTIQALALFIGLFDKRNLLLAIEEPENAIHPWILRQFIDRCEEANHKQIIMTTHSPVLLNYVSPKIIRLMFMIRGQSKIHSFLDLSPGIAELTISGQLSPFDVYDSGLLPQAIPPGLIPAIGQNIEDGRD